MPDLLHTANSLQVTVHYAPSISKAGCFKIGLVFK